MIRIENGRLYRRYDNELLCIEPWGPDAFRVRATERAGFLNDDTRQALTYRTLEQLSGTRRSGAL